MICSIYKKAFAVLKKRPVRLWGISLLSGLLVAIANLGFAAVPAVGFVVSLALSVSMAMIYLNSYRTGLQPKAAYLFSSFKKERFWRVVGGMSWMSLWVFLWSLIPIVGIVFGTIRAYEYRFTPYILMTRDDVSPTQAIEVSKKETMGHKAEMFWADMFPVLAYIALAIVLSLFGMIPYVGVLFKILYALVAIAYCLFLPLFLGIVEAAFYVELHNTAPEAPAEPVSEDAVLPETPAEEKNEK